MIDARMPFLLRRFQRLQQVVYGPQRSGRSRRGAPVRSTTKMRSSHFGHASVPGVGACGEGLVKKTYSASLMSCRLPLMPQAPLELYSAQMAIDANKIKYSSTSPSFLLSDFFISRPPGSIPACAGKPTTRNLSRSSSRVYSRVGRDHDRAQRHRLQPDPIPARARKPAWIGRGRRR